MHTDILIVGAGPAGIFTALELLKKGSKKHIMILEKGKAVENRRCPKQKTQVCVNCKPSCHITTGFSGAGAFSGAAALSVLPCARTAARAAKVFCSRRDMISLSPTL